MGCGIFVQRNVWEAPFNTPTKTVAESESLVLKMGKIVKDDTGSGRGMLGENACGRREAAQKWTGMWEVVPLCPLPALKTE